MSNATSLALLGGNTENVSGNSNNNGFMDIIEVAFIFNKYNVLILESQSGTNCKRKSGISNIELVREEEPQFPTKIHPYRI